jgi:hypothetical protein
VVPALPVDEVVEFADLEPDAIDQMAARGLVPQSGTDAAKLYPDLFPSIPNPFEGGRSEPLHEACAAYWFEWCSKRGGPGQI